jgi:20S proteasome subunit beta 2
MAAHRLSEHAFKYGGHVGTHLIIGGYDVKGPQLMSVQHDGNSYGAPYLTLGSGSLAADGIFESNFREGLERQEAIDLVVAAIKAGIIHDLGSGSNVDVCVIEKDKVWHQRSYIKGAERLYHKPEGYKFKKERVQVLEEYKHKTEVTESMQVD